MLSTSIYSSAPGLRLPDPAPPSPSGEMVDILRQMFELQKEQVLLARHMAQQADSLGRWRNFLARWADDFPGAGQACKDVLPAIERAYLSMVTEITDRLRGEDAEDLDNEYVLNEFLDKYGSRLNQLGGLMGQLSPLADAAPPPPPPPAERPPAEAEAEAD